MKEIDELWDDFRVKPFPEGYAGVEIEGIELVSLDTFAAGCIDTFVDRKGRLNLLDITVLKQCSKELAVVVKSLDGEAKSYFEQLLFLSKRVLESVELPGH